MEIETAARRKSTSTIRVVNPFECRMWAGHNRLPELITEESCKDEIESFLQHGQKQPVLGRALRGDSRFQIELIYGARRLFVAQHLNAGLLVDVRELTDREAFVEMDVENRLRRDLSPYERGMSYKEWLRSGYFSSQKDIAAALGISDAQVSRLLKFAELPAVIVRAFGSQAAIRESWAIMLADRCKDPEVKLAMTCVARRLESRNETREPVETLRLLLDCQDKQRRARATRNDTVVRSAEGQALFRISYRNNEVHIVLPRHRAPTQTIDNVADMLRRLMEADTELQAPKSLRAKVLYKEIGKMEGARIAV